ncbi:MAG: DUF2059 domain-containing protein [Kiloniellales bacterium]
MYSVRRISMTLLIAGALTLPNLATADEAHRLAQAKRALELSGTAAIATQMMDQINGQMTQLITMANPDKGPLVTEIVENMLMPEFHEQMPVWLDSMAQLFARSYSNDELDAMVAFYESPAGKSILKKQPQVMAQAGQLGQAWGQQVAREALRKAAPKLKEQGLEMPI